MHSNRLSLVKSVGNIQWLINTYKSLFQDKKTTIWSHIPICVAIFQRTMESLLQGLWWYCGQTLEHLHNLREVLHCFDFAGASLRKDKSAFMMDYLGHVIDEQDLPERVKALIEALSSCSVLEFRLFLKLLNYYCKPLPNLWSLLNSFTIY